MQQLKLHTVHDEIISHMQNCGCNSVNCRERFFSQEYFEKNLIELNLGGLIANLLFTN